MILSKMYIQIEQAVTFANNSGHKEKNLLALANSLQLAPEELEMLVNNWGRLSVLELLQYAETNYAKYLMEVQSPQATLFDLPTAAILNQLSRAHHAFVEIIEMTPQQYNKDGLYLIIKYNYGDTLFGKVLIASTEIGVCWVAFLNSTSDGLTDLKTHYANASFVQEDTVEHQRVVDCINHKPIEKRIKLHIKGTPFQLAAWQALLAVREGQLITYGYLADKCGNSKGSRAIGNAIGKNPIAYLIPCHRVIQQSGLLGGYRWTPERKSVLITYELARTRER